MSRKPADPDSTPHIEPTWWWGNYIQLTHSINFNQETTLGGYQCQICKRKFQSKRFDVLRSHIKVKHNYYTVALSDIKRISVTCEFCNQPMKCTGYNMRLHRARCRGQPATDGDIIEPIVNILDTSEYSENTTLEIERHDAVETLVSTSNQLRKELKLLRIVARSLLKTSKSLRRATEIINCKYCYEKLLPQI